MIKILLVDSDTVNNLVTQRLFKKVQETLPCQLEICLDGLEAISTIRNLSEQEYPDFILLDIATPATWELLEHLEQRLAVFNKKCIVQISSWSINPDDHLKSQGFNCVSGFSPKPLYASQLEDILKSLSK